MVEPLPSQSDLSQVAEAVARAALSAIPFAGGAAVELLQFVANRGRAARMQRWIEEVSSELGRLGVEFESLATSDGFLDAIGPATRAAVETASTEKIEALRNAVVNAATAPDYDADRHAILLDIVVRLTPTHIKLLKLFDDPQAWYDKAGRPVPQTLLGGQHLVVRDAYPELANEETLLERVTGDLERERLSSIALKTMMSSQGVLSGRTMPLGKELLGFIAAPNNR